MRLFILVTIFYFSTVTLKAQNKFSISLSPVQLFDYKSHHEIHYIPRIKVTIPVIQKSPHFSLLSGIGIQLIKNSESCLISNSSIAGHIGSGFSISKEICEYRSLMKFTNVIIPIDLIFFPKSKDKNGLIFRVSNNTTIYNSKARKFFPFNPMNKEIQNTLHTILSPIFNPELAMGYLIIGDKSTTLLQLYFNRRKEDATFNTFGFEVTFSI